MEKGATTRDRPSPGKRRLTIAKAIEANDLTSDKMPFEASAAGESENYQKLLESGIVDGFVLKVLFDDAVGGVSLTYVWFKANYRVPRHSHNADCTYYVVSGEAHVGSEVLRAGDVFFVPSETLYGYQAGPEGAEILEFRTAAQFTIRMPGIGQAILQQASEMVADNRSQWLQQEPPLAARRFFNRSL
ncbi:MAG TPA: hypothetical protein VN154_02885 [Rhizomicrobium sp.]|nr:hypothetical protein [Rhizomicrobium sp.]